MLRRTPRSSSPVPRLLAKPTRPLATAAGAFLPLTASLSPHSPSESRAPDGANASPPHSCSPTLHKPRATVATTPTQIAPTAHVPVHLAPAPPRRSTSTRSSRVPSALAPRPGAPQRRPGPRPLPRSPTRTVVRRRYAHPPTLMRENLRQGKRGGHARGMRRTIVAGSPRRPRRLEHWGN